MSIYKKLKTSIKDSLAIERAQADAEQNSAKIDYIAMMCGVDIDEEADNEQQI